MRIAITRREALDTPDGINIFIFTLAEALLKLGHEVLAVSSTPSDPRGVATMFGLSQYPTIVSLTHQSAGRHVDAGRTWLRHGRRALSAWRPDAVLINGALPLKLPGWSCAISHDLEGSGRRERGHPWLRRLYKMYAYRRVDHIVATTRELRLALSAEIRIPASRISCLPTCVNPRLYADLPLVERERAILHMGTVWYKNPGATIRAFASMADSNARLYVTGNPAQVPPDALADVPRATRDRIDFVGHLPADELRQLLGRVMVVSVPSKYVVPVASPTAIESFAAGTPVVGSPGLSRDLIVDGGNGFVCPMDDVEAISRSYSRLLNDPGLWEKLHDSCRNTAERFSADRVARDYVDLIEARGYSR